MKALLFIDSLTGAGAQRQLVNLAVGLSTRGHEVTVATFVPIDFFRSQLEDNSIEHLCFNKSYRFDLMPAWRLYRLIARHDSDVVVAFLRTPAFYAELVKLLKPSLRLIVSERAGVIANEFNTRDWLAGAGHLVATHITANSHDYLSRLVKAIPLLAKKTSVIYNGVDAEFFANGAIRLHSLDRPSGSRIPENTRFCVVAARANHQKDPMTLVKALIILNAKNIHNYTIDWIGPVDFESPLVQKVCVEISDQNLSEKWRWRGPCEQAAVVYPEYDAFILPSIYEGVANTMCEAMCSALPVIATDIADNRAIIENNHAGIICDSNDPASLALAIEMFLGKTEQERTELSLNAYSCAGRIFSMDKYVDSWEALCKPSSLQRNIP